MNGQSRLNNNLVNDSSNVSNGKSLALWILAWLFLVIIQFFESPNVERMLMQAAAIFLLAKKNYWGRVAALFLSGSGVILFLLFAAQFYNEISRLKLIFWIFYAVFYLGLFLFLLKKKIKFCFKTKNVDADVLEANFRQAQRQIRVCALVLFVVGILELIPLEALGRYNFSAGAPFFGVIYIAVSCGVFFLSNIARLVVIFLGFLSPVVLFFDWRHGHLKFIPQHIFEIFITFFFLFLASFLTAK